MADINKTHPDAGVQITHLLQIQAQLTTTIHESVSRAKDDVIARMEEGNAHLQQRINELKAKQDIANGRTSKLEHTVTRLRTRLEVRLRDGAGFWQALTPAQKAKLAAVATLVITAIAEGVHRVIPALLEFLAGTAKRP
jgi:predicted RecB family endonuclease